MYIRLVYSKESETISFAASELKYYLSKITNSIVFVDDSTIQHSTIALEPVSYTHLVGIHWLEFNFTVTVLTTTTRLFCTVSYTHLFRLLASLERITFPIFAP